MFALFYIGTCCGMIIFSWILLDYSQRIAALEHQLNTYKYYDEVTPLDARD